MSEPNVAALALRLDRVERQNTWWRRGCTGGLLVMASLMLMGQVQPKVRSVEMERLVIKDSTGRVRATLGPEGQKDGTTLQFFGKDGKPYAWLGILVDSDVTVGSTLWLGSRPRPDGVKGGALLAVVSNFDSGLSVSSGKTSAHLRGELDGGVLLTMSDSTGNVGTTIGTGALVVGDSRGKPRAGMTVSTDGSPSLKLLDKDGKAIWKAP